MAISKKGNHTARVRLLKGVNLRRKTKRRKVKL
jgi:hypothetical protein